VAFGVLGIGRVLALVLGLTFLIDTNVPEFQIAWPAIGAVAAEPVLRFFLVLSLAVAAHRRKVVSGREDLLRLRARFSSGAGDRGASWCAASAGRRSRPTL
jgi:membrane-bound serine protease (ClpP class)